MTVIYRAITVCLFHAGLYCNLEFIDEKDRRSIFDGHFQKRNRESKNLQGYGERQRELKNQYRYEELISLWYYLALALQFI